MKRNIFFLVCCLILAYAYQREFAEKTVFGTYDNQNGTPKDSGEENAMSDGSNGQYKKIMQIFADFF